MHVNVQKIRTAALILALLPVPACCDRKNIPNFIGKLSSSSAKERNEAALSLARCGEKAGGAVPRLAQLLYDDNAGVQSSATYALRQIDTAAARNAINQAEAMRRRQRK